MHAAYGVLLQAAATVLGLPEAGLGDAGSSFRQLGGDSLASIQFGRALEELTGAALPVPFILDHSHSLRDIVAEARTACPDVAAPQLCFSRIQPEYQPIHTRTFSRHGRHRR
jgi:hypothetical protein